MLEKERRIRIFEETMRLCATEETLRRAVSASAEGQHILWQEEDEPRWQPRFDRPAQRIVSGKRSFEAASSYARKGQKACVLNFASSVSPGGGVPYGSQAQEESLCRASSLYTALSHESAKAFYARHWDLIRAGAMKRDNRDDCIYTPGVVVLREDCGEEALLPEELRYRVDVITCAAPDLRMVEDGSRYAPTEAELLSLLVRRWRRILALAAAGGAQALILGAFGCGVFANPPMLVAQAFKQAFEPLERCFETVEFAVYTRNEDSPNRRAFTSLCASEE